VLQQAVLSLLCANVMPRQAKRVTKPSREPHFAHSIGFSGSGCYRSSEAS
jgi:hypothetical protein